MKKILGVCLVFGILLLSGCSTKNGSQNQPAIEDPFLNEFETEMAGKKQTDPFEGYNRMMTDFNDALYMNVLDPVAKGYKEITHEEIRTAIANFLSNLFFPVSFVNNILQGEIQDAGTELGRFLLNSTLGFFGMVDVAKDHYGIEPKKEDFGQTLGVWGIGSGPHIVLPILGPSNLRDIVGIYPDSLLNPVDYIDERSYNLVSRPIESTGVRLFGKVNDTAINEGQYEAMKKDAIDLYPFLKNMYEQYRTNQIKE